MLPLLLSVLTLLSPSEAQEKSNLEKLIEHVPGVPGEDYPIFSFAPDTSFLCEIQPVEVSEAIESITTYTFIFLRVTMLIQRGTVNCTMSAQTQETASL